MEHSSPPNKRYYESPSYREMAISRNMFFFPYEYWSRNLSVPGCENFEWSKVSKFSQ